jgi:hypothetical protein
VTMRLISTIADVAAFAVGVLYQKIQKR